MGGGRPFRWTPRRDAELRALLGDRFSYREIGIMLGCSREEAVGRMAELRRRDATAPVDFTIVPRPPAAPIAAGQRPLIDLSKAPSSMEARAAAWGRR